MNSGQLLIAESGGTKTDWVLIAANKVITSFTTSSFHPRSIDESIKEESFLSFLSTFNVKNTSLHFYGAGCHNEINASNVAQKLNQLNFQSVHVKSDLVAAALASYQGEPGWVAIMGTGSVLCYFDGERITQLKGGLGYLLGDEGSGFYFGKLLLEAYLNNSLSDQLNQFLSQKVGDRNAVIAKVYGQDGVKLIAGLASMVKSTEFPEVDLIHKANIQLFIDKYWPIELNQIGIIGSYGQANAGIVRQLLGIQRAIQIIERPIDALTEYYRKRTV